MLVFMGIYDNKKKIDVKFGFSLKQLKYPLLGLLAIALIMLAFFGLQALQAFFQPQAISAFLNPNPLDFSTAQTTSLTVDVVNITKVNASTANLKVIPVASEMFVVTPTEKKISTIEADGRREFVFLIRPYPSEEVPAGDYKIQILFSINGQEFSKELVLQIKKA